MNDLNLMPHEAERNPIVFARAGEVFANSRDVAAYFGKQHGHVLRDIDNLIKAEPRLGVSNFGEGSFTLPTTGDQQHRMFEMNRDGFTLLAMGFTGAKALKWKLAYIQAFNAMETSIRQQAEQPINLNDPHQLRTLLLSYSEKAEKLQEQVDELLPKQEALQRISEADGSLCITDAAKALQVAPKALFRFLQDDRWIYRRAGSSTWLGYQGKVIAGLIEHKVTIVHRADGTEKVTEQVRITAKGLAKLAELFSQPKH